MSGQTQHTAQKSGQTTQNPDATLRVFFGVELELVLTRKPHKGKNWKNWSEAADGLSKLLQQNNIRNRVVGDDFSQPPDYKLWNISTESTIDKPEDDLEKWGMELISSICVDTERVDWVRKQERLWRCVKSNFNITASTKCGTHVHVSFPSLRAFTVMRMRRVCKAVVYFERCIDSIMPSHRHNNIFCGSNLYNENLKGYQTMSEVFKAIDTMKTHTDLANLISPNRFFRWNFRHMATDKVNLAKDKVNLAKVATVEFRQPPGCTTFDEAIFWQGFTLAFMAGAIASGSLINPKHVPSMADLALFVSQPQGRSMYREVYSGGFDKFIKRHEKLKEGMFPEGPQPLVRDQDRAADVQPQKMQAAFAAHG